MVTNTRPPPPYFEERDHYLETRIMAMLPGDLMKVDGRTIGSEAVINSLRHNPNFEVERRQYDNTLIIKRVAVARDYESVLMDYYGRLNAIRNPEPAAYNVPDEYKELADPNSEMFDPLTCIKNGVKVKR